MTVTICILGFGVLTGGSVNPARTIGPAVASGVYDGIGVYLAAQLAGAICAGVLYRWFWIRDTSTGGPGPGNPIADEPSAMPSRAPAE
jgi:hypothetical protein